MPYITRNDRMCIQAKLNGPRNPGELNYAISALLNQYMVDGGLEYTHINDCLGALEGAKLEFYRRVAAPYEDKKREENGDVYSPDVLTD